MVASTVSQIKDTIDNRSHQQLVARSFGFYCLRSSLFCLLKKVKALQLLALTYLQQAHNEFIKLNHFYVKQFKITTSKSKVMACCFSIIKKWQWEITRTSANSGNAMLDRKKRYGIDQNRVDLQRTSQLLAPAIYISFSSKSSNACACVRTNGRGCGLINDLILGCRVALQPPTAMVRRTYEWIQQWQQPAHRANRWCWLLAELTLWQLLCDDRSHTFSSTLRAASTGMETKHASVYMRSATSCIHAVAILARSSDTSATTTNALIN